jgi:hypothetical protein
MAHRPGDIVRDSGVYNVKHDPKHAAVHEVTCVEGSRFPPCKGCDHPTFELVRAAIHVKDHRSFTKK